MINRRKFVATLGASTLLPAVSGFGSRPEPLPDPRARSRVNLNGQWERFIDGKFYDSVVVPSSRHPMGFYSLKKSFLLPRLNTGERAYVHFDAITYFGRVKVNGEELGTMGPYVPYEFEITRQVKEGTNLVEVAIRDLVPGPDGEGKDELALGVNPGWEAYGGIIRDVCIELRPAAFIENVRFWYKLNADYSRAECQTQVYVTSREAGSGNVELVLKHGTVEVARGEKAARWKAGQNEVEIAFELKDPALWWPESPQLYELHARLKAGTGEDAWGCRTGFREVKTVGREFRLNGKKLILNGVCRHDMWKEQGFTLTRAQQEQDMRMIKGLGCNFIRLVHYPHDRHIVELADELGLLVSEEPGYWNMNFQTMPRGEIELGYKILETTIRRDWNSPSVFAWLLSNECTLTVESLKEGKQRCNQLDPIKRLVSTANSMGKEKAKPIMEQAGIDFFDQHPYTFDVDDFNKEAEFDGPSKPLTFTEWGGKAIGQSQIVMQNSVDRLLDLIESGELSGTVFWSWQDMRQYSRIDGEMRSGVLESGVVTEGREPRDVVSMELTRLFEGRRHDDDPADTAPQVLPLRWIPWTRTNNFHPVDLQPLASSTQAGEEWSVLEARMAKFWTTHARDQWKRTGQRFRLWPDIPVQIAGVPFRIPAVNGYVRPLVLNPGSTGLTIPIGQECSRLHILGNVTLPDGFPSVGKDGDTVGSYTLRSSDGQTQEIPLRSGYEVARANLIDVATRIEAVATEAQPALFYRKDLAREHYQVLLLSVPVKIGAVASLTFKLNGDQQSLAIFAVTGEQTSA